MVDSILLHLEKVKSILSNKVVSSYQFNLKDLPLISEPDKYPEIRTLPNFTGIFEDLNLKKSHVMYWFECRNNDEALTLMKMLDDSRDKLFNQQDFRAVPPKNMDRFSKVIYLGVRRGGVRKRDGLSNISGRVVQHLGYYPKGRTGALQIAHWAERKDLPITLNVIELDSNLENQYLYIIEKLASIELKPLCGKH